ncbi:hypothetical protein CEXT_409361, partial [Caerostris extrusa]
MQCGVDSAPCLFYLVAPVLASHVHRVKQTGGRLELFQRLLRDSFVEGNLLKQSSNF